MIDKDELIEQIKLQKTTKEIAEYFECSNNTVRRHLKKHDLKTNSLLKNWDIEKLRGLASTCKTKREILLKMGFRDGSINYRLLNKVAKMNDISLPLASGAAFTPYVLSDEDFFIENSDRKGTAIKKRLLKMGVKEECAICQIGPMWNDIPLVHQIDHINGVHTDNRIENLRLLCPNCHSQQETSHRAKKTRKIFNYCMSCNQEITKKSKHCKKCSNDLQMLNVSEKRKFDPTVSELEKVLKEHNYNMSAVGRHYSVSDNAVRKRCKKNEY